MAILERFTFTYEVNSEIASSIFNNLMRSIAELSKEDEEKQDNSVVFEKKIKIGLLTNEIPPVVYGGVATWIVNFIKMFDGDEDFEIIPIFLAYNDKLPEDCFQKYKNLRVINNPNEVHAAFNDIDVCVNNLWIAEDTINQIKDLFPSMNIVTVCHSLIRMENITNMGSCYTNNFNHQEVTFQNSDYVVLISKAEENYYNKLGYSNLNTKTRVIYNSYTPQFDDTENEVNYDSNDSGYIGRHVPRKRPELPIMAINALNKDDVKVYNMGVDYDKYDNEYWKVMEKEYEKNLVIIPFSTDKKIKEDYWKSIGINCITGIYEPFGYTICESIDRSMPVIVSNIDGPKEIIDEVKDYVYTYEVDVDNYENDIENISKAFQKVWETPAEVRKFNSQMARKCLDKLRPECIRNDWRGLIYDIIN
jgi:glycosyltransferase involved in cell wall biosynthesis